MTDAGWLDGLPAEHPVMVVAEGLLCYLTDEDVHRLLARIVAHFPAGEVAFDAFSRLGVRLTRYHPAVRATGATLRWGLDDPHELTRQVPGLTFDTVWHPVSSPDLAKVPAGYRAAVRLMNVIPAARNVTRLLRYRF